MKPLKIARMIVLFLSLCAIWNMASLAPQVTAQETKDTSSAGSGTGDSAKDAKQEVSVSIAGIQIGNLLQHIAEREGKLILCEDAAFAALKAQTFNVIPQSFKVPYDKYNTVMNSILDTTLRMRGYVLIRGEPVWKVLKVEQAREHPSIVSPISDIDKLPTEDRIVTQVIKLFHADATMVAGQIVAAGLRGRADAAYLAIPETSTLIITDYASNIKRNYEIIKAIDTEMPLLTEIRQLKYVSTAFIVPHLTQYVAAMSTGPKAKSAIRILPDDRSNSVIIVAQEKELQAIKKVIDAFDIDASKTESNYYVYKLTNTTVEDVHKVVDGIFRRRIDLLGTSAKVTEKSFSVQIEKSSNSLIIYAPEAMYKEMAELIKQIDIKKKQVLLEVIIAELTDEKMVQLGVELASIKAPSDKFNAFGGTSVGISKIDLATGTILPVIPNVDEKGGSMTVGLWKDTRTTIPFLLQASQKGSGINLKAAPILLANDNVEASINMAEQAPYFTTTYPGGSTLPQTNFGGYVKAEMTLKITPYISEDDYIRLVIEQTSEQFLGEPKQDTPKTTRTAKTTVTVPDRETVVIGGLTREVISKVVSKVPLLGDIPLLGLLFRKTVDSVRKYHLCIFIKPNIMKEFNDLIQQSKEAETKVGESEQKMGIRSSPAKTEDKDK
ncbi:MAG: secretin N-terminal domain-containing protein [Planctomycetota bacterium]|nr:secretin N-terminal domain-containing protein [Planctomycetota bacterium]MDI6787443.1 secretin N-terminal domain-containing protein [Planctomycetota bacterium]